MLKKTLRFIFVLIICCSHVYTQGVGQGTRIDLTLKLELNSGTTGQFAQLFIPDYFKAPADGKFDLVFHLHTASLAAEDQVYKANANAIMFNIHLGGFSSSYEKYFFDQPNFQKILDTIFAVLERERIISNPQIQYLIITSFSAGYAGVREIIKDANYYNMINVMVLVDGLHCDSDPETRVVQMKDFLRFAKDARDKQKIMLLTHSSILTNGYENTNQTADYLINGIGSSRVFYSDIDIIGTQYSRCDTGYFHLKGYYGDTANDHLKHLYAMNIMLQNVIGILSNHTKGLIDAETGASNFAFMKLLSEEIIRHPQSKAEDIYKFIHQAAFGSEHTVKDTVAVRKWMENEVANLDSSINDELINRLSPDGKLVRINLRPFLKGGYDPNLLLDAFVKTANNYEGSAENFKSYWKATSELADAKKFTFTAEEMDSFFEEQSKKGFPAVHHSKEYVLEYKPAYRVVNLDYLPFLEE